MYTTKNVNRKTHCQLQAEQRLTRKNLSQRHRRANPTVPHRPRFEHHYTDTLREVYNALSKTKSGAKVYITTIKDLIMRMKWEYWRDNEVTPKTMRNYIHKLASFGMIEPSQKNGVWTIKIVGGELPNPSEIRAKFFSLYRRGQTFPLGIYNVFNKQCRSYQDTNHILKKLVREEYTSNQSDLIRSAAAKLTTSSIGLVTTTIDSKMDEVFEMDDENLIKSQADEYYSALATDEGRRRIGINTHRKNNGMELLPKDMPLRPKKTEFEMGRRRQYAQTHTNAAPTPEYVKTASEEEIKAVVDAIHTPENDEAAELFFEKQSKLLGYSRN